MRSHKEENPDGSSRPQPRLLSRKLREIRKRLEVTQQVMAEIVGQKRSPVYPGHISEFEAGRREPSLLGSAGTGL